MMANNNCVECGRCTTSGDLCELCRTGDIEVREPTRAEELLQRFVDGWDTYCRYATALGIGCDEITGTTCDARAYLRERGLLK